MSAERRYVIVDASARRAVPQNRQKKFIPANSKKKNSSLEFRVFGFVAGSANTQESVINSCVLISCRHCNLTLRLQQL
jgi:hypothetical protein